MFDIITTFSNVYLSLSYEIAFSAYLIIYNRRRLLFKPKLNILVNERRHLNRK